MEGFNPKDLSTIGGIVTISLLHSFNPTHWLPFSIVGRAQKWSLSRTLLVTAFGAVLHVISTSLLGITAVAGNWTWGRPRTEELRWENRRTAVRRLAASSGGACERERWAVDRRRAAPSGGTCKKPVAGLSGTGPPMPKSEGANVFLEEIV